MNILERKRYRAVGNNGPDRKKLPSFKKLGEMDSEFLDDTAQLLARLGDHDDLTVLKADKFERDGRLVTNCRLAVGDRGTPCADTFNTKDMRSIFLQQASKDPALDEIDYQTPLPGSEPVLAHVRKWLGADQEFFRSRINILFPGTNVPPHIDTNTSLYVRLLFMVEGKQEFFVKRRNQISSEIMSAGDVYFINQGWTHWIDNLTESSKNRTSLLLSCKWSAIEQYFKLDSAGENYE